MSILRQFLVILVLGALGAAVWHLGQEPKSEESADGQRGSGKSAVTVVVEQVSLAQERLRLEAVGTARAVRSVALHPETAGEVVAVEFKADGMVEKGQILVRLRQEAERLDVELARVQLDDAQRTFDRLEKLRSSGTTTQAALDEARTAMQSAQIALRQAQVDLADRDVKAPFGGHIGFTDVEIGDRVDPDIEIATLDDRTALLVEFEVPEALLGQVKPDNKISVEAWANSGTKDGAIVDIDSRVNRDSRTFKVRARIENADDALRPGMSFRVALDLIGRTAPAVPEIAIQWGGEGSYLWTIVDDAAQRVPVSILQRQAAQVLIEGAIDIGDIVVVEGLHLMRDGRAVEITLREPPIAAGSGS